MSENLKEYPKDDHGRPLLLWAHSEDAKLNTDVEPFRITGCQCSKCLTERGIEIWWMVLCQKCGNKRCPHATDCRNECTRSNEPGQKGSAYEHCGFTPKASSFGISETECSQNDGAML